MRGVRRRPGQGPAGSGTSHHGARRLWRAQAGQHTDTPDRLEAAARPAGPGRASSRRAERSSQRGRRAGGQAARRSEICRGNKQQAERPPPTGTHSGRALRRPEHPWGAQSSPAQRAGRTRGDRRSGENALWRWGESNPRPNAAPGTPAEPQAPPGPRQTGPYSPPPGSGRPV